ncbi:alpha-1,3-mannosyl-glycoprotein 4-beta-N-acetylglucosaminyltransferase C-like [Liolophura sinensis]|uniref:alpha-1,3-mannosyl-glycoprotein 4-beta-N-acetylglucosaminyltransferase C-like n=1 Tax=Liolophura sinensis TaxID=3198878 RepID=UPI0031586EB5
MGFVYIQSTLDSLLSNSNEMERRGVIIVILLADFNETSRMDMNDQLVKKYRNFFDSGLMRTIQAPRSFYPSFKKLKQTYNHDPSTVKWRSKQNFDYAFMMEYSMGLSEYYLQLEDDVVTVPHYLQHIKAFMFRIPKWTCLEFCELGFIAKLYHSYDLQKLSTLLKLFFNEQPNDVIYLHFNELMLQFQRFIRRPTIFQHKGHVSSSGTKRRMIEDMLFDFEQKARLKSPIKPVEFRQLGRVAGPEHSVWAKRRKEAALRNRTLR